MPFVHFLTRMVEVVKVWFLRYLFTYPSEQDCGMRATFWLSKRVFIAIQTASKNYAGRTKDVRSVTQDLLSVIVGPILVKAHIVTIDERETGPRNLVILAIVLVILSFMAGVSVSISRRRISSQSP